MARVKACLDGVDAVKKGERVVKEGDEVALMTFNSTLALLEGLFCRPPTCRIVKGVLELKAPSVNTSACTGLGMVSATAGGGLKVKSSPTDVNFATRGRAT
jgi:hypothetical protein